MSNLNPNWFGLSSLSAIVKALADYTCAELNNTDTGLTFSQRQIIQCVSGLRTGQTTSYRTGDDGDLELGRGASFTTLNCNNPFGNTNRFTDQSGGQTYSDNIVVDWLTGLMWYRVPTSGNWNQAIDGAEAATTGGYTDWFLPNFMQFSGIWNFGGNTQNALNYSPFNITITVVAERLWTSTTGAPNSTTVAMTGTESNNSIFASTKTTTCRYIYCRHFTLADLGL